VELTDSLGYTFEVEFDYRYGPTLESAIANEAPGFTSLSSPHSGSFVVTNTTDGRNLSPEIGFGLYLLFPYPSEVCSLQGVLAPQFVEAAGGSYCSVVVMGANTYENQFPDVFPLVPGQSSGNLAQTQIAGRLTQEFVIRNVPEDQAAVISGQLLAPGYAMLTAYGPNFDGRPGCSFVNTNIVYSVPVMPGCS
jgi:hypothetical protein